MTPEQEIELNTWWVLRQLKKESLLERVLAGGLSLRKDTPFATNSTKNDPHPPSYWEQYKILVTLAMTGAISLSEVSSKPSVWLNPETASPLALELEKRNHKKIAEHEYISILLLDKFDKIYTEYENKCGTNVKTSVELSSNSFYNFHLSKDGELSRTTNGAVESYKMEKGGLRYRIIFTLNKTRGSTFHPTENLAEEVSVSPALVRKEVGNIRIQIRKNFHGIRGEEFIEGKRKSGYRLGLEIRIREV